MNPGGLGQRQLEALQDLVDCWGASRFVLIGAQALACFVHLAWRETEDIDLALMTTVSEYPADAARRFESEEVFRHELDYDQAGPFVLGQEINSLGLNAEERRSVDDFLALIDRDVVIAGLMAREVGHAAPRSAVRRLIAALRIGLRTQ